MPPDPRLENFETSLADILRADTFHILKANLHFLNILDDAIKKALCENKLADFTPRSRSDTLQVRKVVVQRFVKPGKNY